MRQKIFQLLAVLATTLLVVAACDTGVTPDGETVEVESVDQVSLSQEASTDNFGEFDGDPSVPDTVSGVLEFFSRIGGGDDSETTSSIRFSGDTGDDPFGDWFDENFTVTETDSRFSVVGQGEETVNLLEDDPELHSGVVELELALDILQEFEESNSVFSLETTNSVSGLIDVTTPIATSGSLNTEGDMRLDGFVSAAANFNAAMEQELDPDTYQIESMMLAYSASSLFSMALTVEAYIGEGLEGGHFLLTVDYTDDVFVSADNEQEFEQQLLDAVDGSEYEVTLIVYDDLDQDPVLDKTVTVDDLSDLEAQFGMNMSVASQSIDLMRSR